MTVKRGVAIKYNPTSFAGQLTSEHRQWVQSVHKSLAGGLNLGVGTATNPKTGGVNDGVFTQFERGNGSGTLVRVSATGVSGTGASYSWPTTGSLVVNHTLGRVPIGFHCVDSDKDVRVFRTAPPTVTTLTLQPTDRTASVTLYVF